MSEDYRIVTEQDLKNDERISVFLRGNMTAEEEAAFIEELKNDEQLRQQAIATAHLAKAMKEVGEEYDEKVIEALTSINEHDAKYISSLRHQRAEEAKMLHAEAPSYEMHETSATVHVQKASASRKRFLHAVSIAASILLLVGVGFKYYDYRYVTGLGEEFGSTFVSEQTPSRGSENADVIAELQSLYANVQNGNDLDVTIKRLSLLWELSTMKTYNDYTNEAPYIGWNLAIAYLKDNDKEEARSVLVSLLGSTDNEIVKMKSSELLDKIK